MISKERFSEYSKAIEDYTIKINTKESTETKGTVKKLVFLKMAWQESLTWFVVVQSCVIFLGLVDDVVDNVNSGIRGLASIIGISSPFQFPLSIASFIAVSFVLFLFCFGFIGYKYLKTPQTTQLIANRNNGVNFMLWDMIRDLKNEIVELKKEKK